jgi:hypothetical protein
MNELGSVSLLLENDRLDLGIRVQDNGMHFLSSPNFGYEYVMAIGYIRDSIWICWRGHANQTPRNAG